MIENGNIMTLEEMAGYLRIARRSLLKMAQKGDIPATKVASQWRFMRTVVDDWLIRRMKALPEPELERLLRTDRFTIPLRSLLRPELVRLDVRGNSKERILRELCRPLAEAGLLAAPAALLEKLMEREEMVSTAIFPGIAIPHPRRAEDCGLPEPRIVLGVAPAGVDFDSLDGRPTYALFLVCANQTSVHLKIIAQLALLFRRAGLVEILRQAQTPEQALDRLLHGADRGSGGAPD
jgi:PTS system nitrogen regulatory IIA component